MATIYIVSLYLNSGGLKEAVKGFEYKESKGGYIVDRESNFGGKTTRVKKGEILRLDSTITPNLYYVISSYTWCFEKELEVAKTLLFNKVYETAKHQRDVANKLYGNLRFTPKLENK